MKLERRKERKKERKKEILIIGCWPGRSSSSGGDNVHS
jgi:hypothetical protein